MLTINDIVGNGIGGSRRSRRALALLFAATAVGGLLEPAARATTVNSVWTGTTNGTWSTPANWSPSAAYPSNGNGGVSDYNVTINSVTGPATAPTLDVTVTIDSLTLTANATLGVGSGQTLTLSNLALSDAGTITLLGNGSFGVAALNLAATGVTTLNGGGTIVLTDGTFSRINSSGNLTNANATIQGAGFILCPVTNQAIIRALGGTLSLNGIVDNSNGTLSVAANGTLSVNNTVTGGNLTTTAGAQVLGGGTLANVTLTTGSALSVPSGQNSPILSGTFTNKGTVTMLGNGSFGVAALTLATTGNVTLNGGGSVVMTDGTFSRISSGNLTNVDNTIQGAGIVLASVVNQGTITATGGILTFNSNLDNTAGTLNVTANGTLSIGGTLTGSVSTAAGGQLAGSGTLSNVTLNTGSSLTIPSGVSSPMLSGTFTNKGFITVLGNGTLGVAQLTLGTGTTTLTGGGTIVLSDGTFSRIATGTLLNANDTIQGAGIILANITNQSSIIATGGTLTFNTNIDTTGGTLSVTANGTISFGGTLTGTISVAAGGQIIGGGTLSNVTLNPGSSWSIPSGTSSPTLLNTFANKGNITILGNGTLGAATLTLGNGTTTLNGGGSIFLTDATFSRISTGTLLNLDNILQGAGTILCPVTNQGTIRATGGTLTLNANVTNTSGSLIVTANGTVSINATLTGSISAAAGSQIIGGGTLSNVTLLPASSWTIISGNASPILAGTFTNDGTVTVLGNSTLGVASISLANGTTTLNGGGTVLFTDSTFSRISTGNLTNVDNTLQGAGTILCTLINQGTLHASNGTLTLNGNVTGSGNVTIDANASMAATNFSQIHLTNNGSFSMTGSGNVTSINGNGTLNLSGHLAILAGAPTITQSGLTTSGANALDITNNKFVIQPSAPNKAATLAAMQNEVNTHSITSSTIAPTFGVAVVDNGVLATPFSTFGGVSVNSGSILMAPELLGDSNIDGHVDLTDLNAVLNHLGATTPAWTNGNFDGAATIDLTDLNDVLNALGVTFAGNASVVAAEALVAGTTPTPEPYSLLFLSLGLVSQRALGRRRVRVQT